MNTQRFYNPIVIRLLRSPLHRFGDQHTIVLTVTGRKSGKSFTFPVSYLQDGETLLVMTHREHTWWKNLQGSAAPLTVYFDGQDLPARAEISTEPDVVAKALLQFLQQVPTWRWETRIKLDANGQPEHPEDLTRLAQRDLVLCKIQLERAPSLEPEAVQPSAHPAAAE
ncbi:MAG: nitroreductase/quinone reductase family protein [Ktedonobacterales bacterium]